VTGITFNIWAVIILLGAVQGLFLSLYLLAKSDNRHANKWLAFLLGVISLHLLEYAATISGTTVRYPALTATTYPLLFCMGPFYFFYCRSLVSKKYSLNLKAALHFIPAALVLFAMLPFYTMPATEKINFIRRLSDGDSIKIPADQLVFMALHVLQTVAYIFAAYKFIGKKEEELKHYSSDVIVVKKLDWLNRFNLGFSVYLLLYLALVIILSVIDSWQLQVDYIMLLVTSCSIYAIGYAAIQSPEIFKAFPDLPQQQLQVEAQSKETLPRNRSKHAELKETLLVFMESNKPYLKSDLKISELADLISVPSYQLSQVINDEFGVSFYDFINKYRVEEAKRLLIEDSRNYKILAIAYEVGFNSKATFNRVFKKFTDLTPSDYKEQFLAIKNNSGSSPS
jgi:AraC-like DNA-binding protein